MQQAPGLLEGLLPLTGGIFPCAVMVCCLRKFLGGGSQSTLLPSFMPEPISATAVSFSRSKACPNLALTSPERIEEMYQKLSDTLGEANTPKALARAPGMLRELPEQPLSNALQALEDALGGAEHAVEVATSNPCLLLGNAERIAEMVAALDMTVGRAKMLQVRVVQCKASWGIGGK